ncbi:MAG: methionyl-tRNA formyltransferase [Tepidimonas sp.]|uniref:methionyl-tRNA formyltransferase n=1 Tax=Tepidimonas sp. TaxID=2002775 RepID=UPI00259DE7D2|nr:methionyl-tRNA formyltransferase [Tepidimonas sp.]MDM7456595.1 methionyl-tRNA formyltransferase [Tepidimonas sp.]
MRVAFAGTPVFAARALQAIAQAGFPVVSVLTQPDRPAGRGMKLQPSPVKALAQMHGWPIAQPRGLRLDGRWAEDAACTRAALQAARPDVLVVAAYGLILPRWVLDLPRLGCLNIHASLLPRWRGAAPIQRAIEAGDAQTGITLMQMDEGLDTGDIVAMEAVPIGPTETAGLLHDRLAGLGARLVVQALRAAEAAPLPRRPQPDDGVTYAHKIDKAEAMLDWSAPAALLERRVRAFDPVPGAATTLDGAVLKVWGARAEAAAAPSAAPGTVLAADATGIRVQTGQGVLVLTEVQRAGGKRLAAGDFLRGTALSSGVHLGAAA